MDQEQGRDLNVSGHGLVHGYGQGGGALETLIHLDTWDKLMMVAGAVAALCLTIFLIVCCVGDGCLIHDLINRHKRKKLQERKLSGSLYGTSDKNGVNLTNFTGQAYTRTDTVHLPSRQNSVMSAQSEQSLLSRLTSSRSRSRADSTYSSMSSGRTSPSSINRSTSSVSSSSPLPPDLDKCPPSISFSVLASVGPDTTAKLVIGVESCTDLPGRDYGAHCDPWVSITVNRDRRSLRRRPPSPITQFRTKTIRHAHNPFYSQTFVTDIQKVEMKDISVVFAVMDQDRHCGAVEIGRAGITLKEAKQTVDDPVKFSSHCPLLHTKRDCGEILFGLSYLPTAQRLSFSLVKINNIKVEKNNEEPINPYLRILMFNQSGRLVKKKKTTIQFNTKDPVFNETLNFEVSPHQLDSSRFLITLCSRRPELDMMVMEDIALQDSSDQDNSAYFFEGDKNGNRRDSQGKPKDSCLGKIAIGKSVTGEKEREHYRSVMETPRQVFSMWHTLR